MKYMLMILFSSIWLHAFACEQTCCAHRIEAEQYLYTEESDLLTLFNQFKSKVQQLEQTNPVDVVVIDPGHGGKDKGCSGVSSIEKLITLELSKKLQRLIKQQLPGVDVILTRDRDKFISLKKRAQIANENKADIFISVHCNYLRNAEKFRGSETFVLGNDDNSEASEKLAIRENESIAFETAYLKDYGGFDPLSPESYIMFSMFQNIHLNNSIVLAQLVDASLYENTAVKSKGVKQGAFVVLKETKMPSILVEAGYLSNIKDEQLLTSKSGQNKIVQAILNAIVEYKHFIE